MKSGLLVPVAGLACVITFFVSRQVLRDRLKLGPPTPLATVVAALAFLGLVGEGEGVIKGLLIPYEALAVILLILFLLFCLSRCFPSLFNHGRRRDETIGHSSERSPPTAKSGSATSRVPQDRLPRPRPRLPRPDGLGPSSPSERSCTRE